VVPIQPDRAGTGGSASGPALRIVLEEEGVEDGFDDLAFLGIESGEGLEVKAEVVVGTSLTLVEQKHICADPQGSGEAAEDVEGGLGAPSLVASQVGNVHPYRLGEGFLAEASLLAEGDDALGKLHDEKQYRLS
jgi:hypothetical protein